MAAEAWQKCGGGGNDNDDRNEGDGGGGRLAAVRLQRRQKRGGVSAVVVLDRPLHDLTPLPAQAGKDAAGVHPAPAATTALFCPGFLADLVRQPQAGRLTDQLKDQPTNQPTSPLNNQLPND